MRNDKVSETSFRDVMRAFPQGAVRRERPRRRRAAGNHRELVYVDQFDAAAHPDLYHA